MTFWCPSDIWITSCCWSRCPMDIETLSLGNNTQSCKIWSFCITIVPTELIYSILQYVCLSVNFGHSSQCRVAVVKPTWTKACIREWRASLAKELSNDFSCTSVCVSACVCICLCLSRCWRGDNSCPCTLHRHGTRHCSLVWQESTTTRLRADPYCTPRPPWGTGACRLWAVKCHAVTVTHSWPDLFIYI